MEWKTIRKRGRRKTGQRKAKVKIKPVATFIKDKDSATTFADVLKLMKEIGGRRLVQKLKKKQRDNVW